MAVEDEGSRNERDFETSGQKVTAPRGGVNRTLRGSEEKVHLRDRVRRKGTEITQGKRTSKESVSRLSTYKSQNDSLLRK